MHKFLWERKSRKDTYQINTFWDTQNSRTFLRAKYWSSNCGSLSPATDPAKYLTSLAFEDCWRASEAAAPVDCKKLQLGISRFTTVRVCRTARKK